MNETNETTPVTGVAIDYHEITDPVEIKMHQERLSEEFKQLAKSLARAKASRTTAMVNAVRKGKRFAMFDAVYKAQDGILDQRMALAKTRHDYNIHHIRKMTVGEADNIWVGFFDAKQRLQEKLIAEVTEKIAQLNHEYGQGSVTKLALSMNHQIQNYHHIAANLGPRPGVTPLSNEQIDADLFLIRSGGKPPPPLESPSPEADDAQALESMADAASAAVPMDKLPFPPTQMPQPQLNLPKPSSIMNLLSPEPPARQAFAIDSLIDRAPDPAPAAYIHDTKPITTGGKRQASVTDPVVTKPKRQKATRQRRRRVNNNDDSRASSTDRPSGGQSPSSSRAETPAAPASQSQPPTSTPNTRQLPPLVPPEDRARQEWAAQQQPPQQQPYDYRPYEGRPEDDRAYADRPPYYAAPPMPPQYQHPPQHPHMNPYPGGGYPPYGAYPSSSSSPYSNGYQPGQPYNYGQQPPPQGYSYPPPPPREQDPYYQQQQQQQQRSQSPNAPYSQQQQQQQQQQQGYQNMAPPPGAGYQPYGGSGAGSYQGQTPQQYGR